MWNDALHQAFVIVIVFVAFEMSQKPALLHVLHHTCLVLHNFVSNRNDVTTYILFMSHMASALSHRSIICTNMHTYISNLSDIED